MKAKIHVTLKNGVLDVQGKAVAAGLASLGFSGIGDVRVGRFVEIDEVAHDTHVSRRHLDHRRNRDRFVQACHLLNTIEEHQVVHTDRQVPE